MKYPITQTALQCVVYIGIQASGKSSFFKERFSDTHVRVNMDMLRTRNREKRLIGVCLETGISFVVDKTNAAQSDRSPYIAMAKANGFSVVGYYFFSSVADALRRNSRREGKSRIPDAGILGTAARLEPPSMAEGFDQLYRVTLTDDGFSVSDSTVPPISAMPSSPAFAD